MKNQRKAWLAAGLLALVAAACFSDPTSDLRSGPVAIATTVTSVSVRFGDSVDVRGVVKDAQGNPLPVGPVTWVSVDPTVAVANLDTIALAPGDIFTRAFIRGETNAGGVTTVTVTAQGISADVRVTVLPATFPGTASVTGTAVADTISISRPAPSPPLVVTFTAGDTLVVNGTATVTFNPTTSSVLFGVTAGVIVSRTANQIKALPISPYAGKVTITNLTYAGDATTGPIAIPTIQTDSITISHMRFHGTSAVTTDANYGTSTVLTVTAPAGMTFDATTRILVGGTPPVGVTAAVPATPTQRIAQTATTISAVVTAATNPANQYVLVTGALLGTVRLDSVRAGTAGSPPISMNRANFSGTAVVTADPNFGAATLLTVTASAGLTFDTVTATVTTLAIGGTANTAPTSLIVLSKSPTVLTAISSANFTGATVLVRGAKAGTLKIDSLRTAAANVVTINKSSFPGTVVQAGTGQLLDTITINSGAVATFTTAAATASVVTLGTVGGVAQQAFIISRTSTVIKAIAKLGNSTPISISNVIISGTTIPSLLTAAPVNVTTVTTGEANEPGNNSNATATPLAFAGAADTITVYGSIDCEDDGTSCPGNGDITDRYLLTTTATTNLRLIVDWYGNGTAGNGTAGGYGSQPENPDLDIFIRTSGGTVIVKDDGLTQPASTATSTALAAGTYILRVDGWTMPGPITYKMRVIRF